MATTASEETVRPEPAPPTGERRQYPRMLLSGELQAELLPSGTPLEVLDLSEHGFSVKSPIGFVALEQCRVRFWTARRSHGILQVANVHCLHAAMLTGSVYFAGFQFANVAEDMAIQGMLREVEELRTASRV